MINLSFRNVIMGSVFSIYIIFSILIYYTFNSFFLDNVLEKSVEKNIIASKIANDYINFEKALLGRYAKQFSNNRFLYLAVKKNKYLNILFNTNMLDLKMRPMNRYYYRKLGSDIKRDAFGVDGDLIRKDIEIFDNRLEKLVDTSYGRKTVENENYRNKEYLNDALGVKNKFTMTASNNFEIIEEEMGEIYLKGVSSMFMEDSENYGVIVVKERFDRIFIDFLKKLTDREIIVMKNNQIYFSTMNTEKNKIIKHKILDKKDNYNYRFMEIDGKKMIVNFFTLIDYNGNPIAEVGVCDYYNSVEKLYKNSLKKFIPYQMIFSLLLLIFLYFTLKKLFSPFDKIIKGIEEIKYGDYNSKIKINTVTELKKLTDSINEMGDMVNEREKKLIELNKDIEDTNKEILITLGEMSEKRSLETGNHIKRVAEYTGIIATKLNLPKDEVEILKEASMMHDVGKIGIPDNILNKAGKLTDEEFEIMKKHTTIGNEIFKNSKRKLLEIAALIALEHHEKWNGTGYPNGLEGENIHIYGRITALADVFDALGTTRCYKQKWEIGEILKYIKSQSGKQFDPKIVEIFFNNIDEFLYVKNKYEDE